MSVAYDVCASVWQEYEFLLATYEGFNDFSFILKGWSVTIALAAILAVYSEQLGVQGKVLLWSAAFCALAFWGLDILWKLYQEGYVGRILVLEEIPDCAAAPQPHSFGIYTGWRDHFQKEIRASPTEWFKAAYKTAFPHLFVLLLGVILAVRRDQGR